MFKIIIIITLSLTEVITAGSRQGYSSALSLALVTKFPVSPSYTVVQAVVS